MSARSVIVTVTGDGTLVPTARTDAAARSAEEVRLQALLRLRALLGDDPEEQIGARLYLPVALGTEPADHLLPASLSLLAGATGDLASYGWRVGAGAGAAWLRSRELRERTVEDARIALLGYEGPLASTVLGPLTLAAATYLPGGERALADRGAVRDLPLLLAEGLAEHRAVVRDRVPGAVPALLVREDAVAAVHAGRIPTVSGYRRHAPLAAPEIGARWQDLREALGAAMGAPTGAPTLALPPEADLIRAARAAGWTRLAFAPAAVPTLGNEAGTAAWEALAEAHDAGIALELVVDPSRIEHDLETFAAAWTRLGHPVAAARGLTLIAHPRAGASTGRAEADPAAQPRAVSLLTEAGLERVMRAAPAWAERLED